MADTCKRKFSTLAVVGLASFSLGGTLMVTDAVHAPTVAYAASETAKQTLAGYIAKGKIILANKGVTGIARDVIVSDQSMATDAYNSGDQESYKQANEVLKDDYGIYDSKGNLVGKKDGGSDESNVDNMGSDIATAEEPGVDSSSNDDTDSNGSDPIKDTQDAHEYEESTAKDENSGNNSTDTDSDFDTNSSDDSNGNTGSSTANSSSATPNGNSTSEFSKESVNAPGNAGSTTGSSNASSTSPVSKSHSSKGNLPGTGEDSNQTVLLATLGLLGILGLGGTELALWLRQRKHVNNE